MNDNNFFGNYMSIFTDEELKPHLEEHLWLKCAY